MNAKQIEKISKALGDPYRIKIMEAVRRKEEKGWLPCTSILEMCNLSQSTVSHHLKQLVDADLLLAEKIGRNAMYKVNTEVLSEYINFLQPFTKQY